MRQVRAALARLAGVFTKDRADDDLREEMQAHLDMETAENVRRGMSPSEARRQALLASGGLTVATDAVRDQRGLPWIEGLAADLKYALRTLRHSPAFAAVVVITLALGIGANTAIFSVVNGVLLKPLPHRDGDRLVYLRQSMDGPGGTNLSFSVPEIRDFRKGAPSLGWIAEYSPWFGTLHGETEPVRIDVGLVTGNFFDVMGLSPTLGRLTRPSDDGSGVPAVMVLTHDFWMKHYGGDSSIVGKQVRLDGTSLTVIGVVEPAPWFPDRMEALANMVISPHHLSALMVEGREHRMTEMIARLAPGATLKQARNEVAAVYARMQRDNKATYDTGSHYRVAVIPFKDALGEKARLTLWLLMGAAAFVMIISAANVANLTLMRGVRREHELVVRAALGAGAGRLRRLLLAENLVLTLIGATLGLGIAISGVRLLTSFADRYSPRANEIQLDTAVLAFTLALSVLLALLLSFVGSLPKEGGFTAAIAAGARRVSGSLRKHRLQRALVVAQVAVSVILLAGAGLLTRTMVRLSQVSTGLKTEEVLTIEAPMLVVGGGPNAGTDPNAWFKTVLQADAQAKVRYEQIRREIAGLPGVIEVGVGSSVPLRGSSTRFELKAEGKSLAVGEAPPRPDFRTASPEYFRRHRDSGGHRSRIRRDRRADVREGRDHQPDARRSTLPRRGPNGQAHCVDWRATEVQPDQPGVAHDRRRGGQYAGRRAGRAAETGRLHALRAGALDERRHCHSRRQQRGGSGTDCDADRPTPRAIGSDSERDDDHADQGSKRRATTAERRPGFLVWHPRRDHRGGRHCRCPGILGERTDERDRHPDEPRSR